MSQDRKQHLIKSLEAGVRIDGRKKDEFRPLSIELGVSSTAEGSALVRAGDSSVIAGVKMGLGKPYPDTPDSGVLMVNAELLPLSNPEFESGPPGIESIEIARVIDRGIRESHAFDAKSLCVEPGESVWMVQCDVMPINFDGNLIDLGGLAALAALLDARFPMVGGDGTVDYHERTDRKLELEQLPVPVTVGKIGKHLLVDPTQEEESALDARLTLTMLANGDLCALQKGGDEPLTRDDIKAMVSLAGEKGKELRAKLLEVTGR
ncbi:exosome complex protein Rrp42 [Candidatus Woesearchaeota archaeon]|nr:exosome complex protein Rrp42 [Candidatus Woesearchaeota archaeon]